MPAIPAICNTCGTVFPSAFTLDNAIETTFAGCGAGPCPRCGGVGTIPDGVYNVVGRTIEILQNGTRSAAQLQSLASLLEAARSSGKSSEELAKQLSTVDPELESLADVLPRTRNELYAFITLVLAAIALIMHALKDDHPQHLEFNDVVNVYYQQSELTPAKHLTSAVPKSRAVGRNEPCPCGSGKKYKKCHGGTAGPPDTR